MLLMVSPGLAAAQEIVIPPDSAQSEIRAVLRPGDGLLLGVDLQKPESVLIPAYDDALGVTSAVAAASYLVSSLAPVTQWIHPLRVASLFYWSVGNDQLERGLSMGSAAVLTGVGVMLTVAAALAFDRLDVH